MYQLEVANCNNSLANQKKYGNKRK